MGRAELNPPDWRKARAAAGAAGPGRVSPCPGTPRLCPPQAPGPTLQPLSAAPHRREWPNKLRPPLPARPPFALVLTENLSPPPAAGVPGATAQSAETACRKPGNGNARERRSSAASAGARSRDKGQQVRAAARGKSG